MRKALAIVTFVILLLFCSDSYADKRFVGPVKGGGKDHKVKKPRPNLQSPVRRIPSTNFMYFWVDAPDTLELWRVDINGVYYTTLQCTDAWPWLWFDGYYVPRPGFDIYNLKTGDTINLWRTR